MSFVKRTAKGSARFVAIGLLFTLVSSIVLAAKWDSVTSFAAGFGASAQTELFGLPDQESKTTAKQSPLALIPQDTKTVCDTGTPDFATMALAVADANAAVPAGGRTYLVCAGLVETAPAGGYTITATGASAANPVVFIKDGIGANPTFTAPTTHTAGALTDAIFKIVGADNITIDGFTMLENPANTTTTAGSNNMTEWGVALLYASTTNGAQNITIQNNTITLNRTYQNTFGVYSNSTHTATAVTTSATATTTAGGNSGLKIYGNNISNVNQGIVVVGPTAAADMNTNVDIGGSSAVQGNTVTNWGTTGTFSGYANVSGTLNGILVRNSIGFNVSFNTITSSVGGNTVTTSERGIYVPSFSNSPTGTFSNTINSNNISIQSGLVSGTLNGIIVETTTGTATSSLTINSNNFNTFGHTAASPTGAATFISNAMAHLNTTINSNTFTNISLGTTGSVTFISNNVSRPASAVCNVNSNSIVTAFNKTGAGGTVQFYISNSTTPSTATETNTGNNFSNVTVTGATTIAGWQSSDGSGATGPVKNVSNNTFQNFTGGSSSITGLNVGFSTSSTVSNNLVSNIIGTNSITGITTSSGNDNFSQNTVHTLSTTGAATVTGFAVTGGTTKNIFRNKIYNLEANNATGAVNGMLISTAPTTGNIYNNLIGDLRTPSTSASNSLNGINITATTTTTTLNVSFNTIYLNAASSGTNFGSSGIFHTTSATATTATLNLRNNIVVNTSTAAGTGLTVAYRRSSTTLTNYGSVSNNNDFYAGTPSATNLIFNDGTNSDQTMATYKARVASRDSVSITENPPFVSTTGSNANFLHISTVTPTQLESGGIPIAGITDDFDGDTRNGSTPDIGADEFTGTGLDLSPPSISYTPLAGTASLANRTLTATITDASGVAGGAFAPRIYFKKSTDAGYVSTQCTGSSPTYTCTIDYTLVGGGAVVSGDIVQYFVVAQDTAGNVGANPSGGFAATNVNTVTSPPASPNSYTILPSISGNKTVGAGGDYPTLTAAVAALNAAEVSGAVTLTLTDASYSAGETFPLTINANNGSSVTNTVTIKPATGVTSSISGSSASCIFNLNGADFMTIDGSNTVGGTTRDLTITNTNAGTSSAVVCLTSLGVGLGATNDTVKNTNLVGSTVTATNGTLFGVISGSSTISTASAGADNDNNTIQNNNITKTQIGIYSGGASAANKNSGTVITQNVMNAASPNNLNNGGILVNFEDGVKVTLNDISIFRHDGTNGQTGTAWGIALGVIPNNSVTVFTGSDVVNGEVSRNKINGVTQLNSTGYSGFGIVVNSVTSGTTLVANNMISGIRTASTASDFSAGIVAGGGTGSTTQVYFNSVAMTGTRGAATFPSYGLAINSGNPIVDIKNNIFYNTQTSSSTGKMYAIGTGSTTFTNMTSSFNDLYVSGASAFVGQTGGLGTAGTDRLDLAAWNTATGQDAPPNSKSVDPLFVLDTTDLHLQATSPLESQGTPIGAVTVDFDGDARPATPDIGADEIAAAAAGTVQFSSATYSVTEGTPTVTLTVTRTGGSSGAVTANYALAGGTATGGAACGGPVDYVNTGGSVIFANGDTADKTFTVNVCDDGLFESSETFDATLSIAAGTATLGTPNPATVTITDNDTQPSLQFSSATGSVGEGGGLITLTVTRTGATENAVSVDYATASGTATGGASCAAGIDFISANGTLNFASGDLSKTFDVTICNDNLFETNESFTATLSNAGGGAAIGTPSAETVTITENDTAPTFQFSSATYTNADDIAANDGKTDQIAPATATITVTRTGATENAVSVNYATSNGTATGGASCTTGVDYISASGTLSFASGDTSKTFNITVCTDSLFEGDETVNLALSVPTAPAVLGTPATSVLTITDNETVPSLQFSSATYTNSDDITKFGVTTDEFAPSVATITVTRTGATDNAVSVNYATSNGTATGGASCTAGIDYISTSGTLSFALGDTSKTFNVTVCTDALFEGNETVNLTLSNPTAPAALGTPNTAVLTIVDNDAQPSLQFSSATYSVGEAGVNATITVTRTGATDNVVSVNYATVAGGTATGGASCGAGIDYTSASGTLNFASGDTSKTFNVPICDDALAETSETVNLALSTPTGAVLGTPNTAVLTITDNDAAPTLQFSAATVSVSESAGTTTLTVTRAGATGNAVSVDYATGGGTATGGASCTTGVDYVSASGTLNFASGDTSKTFNVTICNDNLFEANETLTASLSNATGGATIGTPSAETVTITENDTAPTFQFSSATYSTTESLGNSGVVSGATITVTRTGATENAVSVNYATSNGTATGSANCAAGIDYRSASGTLNFASGDTSKTFFVETCQDFVFEGNETVNLALSAPTAPAVLGTPNTAVLTIVENDPAPSVQFNAATYAEDESQTIGLTVTRTGDTSGTTTVSFATSNGTATGGASCGGNVDYLTNSGTVTFNPGVTSQIVNVQLCGDSLVENTETVNLTLSSPSSPAVLGTPNTAVLNINDTASQFRNNTAIGITNGTVTSASTINVTGATTVGNLRITLYDISHTNSDDLDVLLVGPLGQTFILMGDAGGASGLSSPATITFDDQAGLVLPDNGVISTGKYEPTNWITPVTNFGAGAPNGPYNEPGSTVGGAVTLNSVFNGTDPNGTWSLYIRDDAGAFVPVGTGAVGGGWGIQVLAPTAANAEISGRLTTSSGEGIRNATVMLTGGSLTTPLYVQTATFGNYRFSGLPVGQNYVITVISKRYRFANPSRVINLMDSVTDENFVAEPQ